MKHLAEFDEGTKEDPPPEELIGPAPPAGPS